MPNRVVSGVVNVWGFVAQGASDVWNLRTRNESVANIPPTTTQPPSSPQREGAHTPTTNTSEALPSRSPGAESARSDTTMIDHGPNADNGSSKQLVELVGGTYDDNHSDNEEE